MKKNSLKYKKIEKFLNKLFYSIFILAIIIGCYLVSNKRLEPAFIIDGDPEILKKIVINIGHIADTCVFQDSLGYKIQTVLYKGKKFFPINRYVSNYYVYFSYEDKVNSFSFDNIMWRFDDHINKIRVFKKDDQLFVKYYSRKSKFEKESLFVGHQAIPLEEYFQKNGIVTKEEQELYRKRFFDFFEPDKQKYVQPR